MSILDTPLYRPLVQENFLVGEFEKALFPELLFRSEAEEEEWGENKGDTKIFTGNGLIPVTTAPTRPGDDAPVSTYGREQWSVLQQQFSNSTDIRVPDSSQASVNLVVEDLKALGLNAGKTLNRIARNTMFNAALAGSTVCDGGATSTVTIPVKRLNGLTRARRPDLAGGSAVRFDPVSATNPLPVRWGSTLSNTASIVGFSSTFPNDEIGPGTVTFAVAATLSDRDPIVADTSTWIRRSGGGFSVDSIGSGDLLTVSDLRAALARLSNMTVPKHADGNYHGHMSSVSNDQVFSDTEFRQMYQSLPADMVYKEHALGKTLGAIWFQNAECPQLHTVNMGTGAAQGVTDGAAGDQFNPSTRENFAGELFSNGTATGTKIQRVLITGGKWLKEYFVDQSGYITAAGVNGVVKDIPPIMSESGVTMTTQVAHIKLIQRAPQDRLQQNVSNTWSYVGGLVCRTDAASGDARYQKRGVVIEHAEP